MRTKRYSRLFNRIPVAIFITILTVCIVNDSLAQFNTYSPYTRFGLGDLAKNGFGQNLAMGGTGIAIHKNNRINYLNPAAFSALDSTSVFFDFGANSFHNQYTTTKSSNSWWNMNLHHVAFASSMGKYLGFSAGIVPYSSIGYNIKQEYDDPLSGDALDTYFTGDGSIMNFYIGTAVKFFNRISFGVTMNYLMGRLTRERTATFPANKDYSTTKSRENLDLRKPVFGFGLQYNEVIGEKFFFTLGGIYELATEIDVDLESRLINNIYAYKPVDLNDSVTVQPSFNLKQDTTVGDFTMPRKTGFGIALGIKDKFTITGDYYMQDWTGILSDINYSTTNSTSMHFGAEYTPDVEALRGYHKYITYRVGGYYSNYYLQVNETQLKDYGITFGVGLPVRSFKTSINVAFTLGTRGTTEYNLVEENYGIITFNVTLHDLWFRKRRFD